MSELPKGWVRTTIGEIIKVKSGDSLSSKDRSEGNIPVFGGNGITGYHNSNNLNEPSIVIGRVGFYCGSVHLTPKKAWVTDNAFKVIYSKDCLDFRFLYWLLVSTDLRQNTSSTAQPVISGSKIYPIPIALPPLNEQKRIVEKLDRLFANLDNLRTRLDHIPELLKHFRQSVLTQAVTGKLTEEWRESKSFGKWNKTTVGKFMVEIKDKVNPSDIKDTNYVGLEHIEKDGGLIDVGSSKELKSLKSVFKKGDVLYGKLRPYLNKHVVVPFDGICSTDILVFRHSNVESAIFFDCFLGIPDTVAEANAQAKGINLPRISPNTIKAFEIIVPPLEEQKEIVRRVEALFEKADLIERQYEMVKEKIEHLPQAILSKAFRGELVPQDSNDEPAEALLERIQAEREGKKVKVKSSKQVEKASASQNGQSHVEQEIGEQMRLDI